MGHGEEDRTDRVEKQESQEDIGRRERVETQES
jgi:hypothetical protein